MSVAEFVVVFDGKVGGVQSHRLSIATFKDTLPKLLDAIRWSAERVVGGEGTATGRNRVGSVGRSLDLEMEEISGGSLKLKFVVSLIGAVGVASELESLPQRAVSALVKEIDLEAKAPGGSGNKRVQDYLASLPDGLSRQDYDAVIDGEVVASTTITREQLGERERAIPRMRTVNGRVFSVTTLRSKERVTILAEGGEKFACHATRDMVDLALLFRDDTIVATIVLDPDSRNLKNLVMLRRLHQADNPPSADERWDRIRTKWAGVLKRLAE